MKRLPLTIALVLAFAAPASFAQTSNASTTANSSSNPQVNTNSGNSGSYAGVDGVAATANPNNANAQNITFNSTSGGASTSTMTATTRATQDSTSHDTYDGTQRNITSGGTTNTDNVIYSGTQTIKNVPGIQMSGPASGPCTGVSGGVGLAGPGWGVGFNGSAVMDDCRIRENTRVLGMAMQSIDGNAYPQERGEVTVLFMDAVRGLAAYNRQIVSGAVKQEQK